jgi:sporulation inhibitor KapD
MARNYLLVDYEFTTYTRRIGRPRAYFSEIIEVGAVLFSGEDFRELGRLQNFVNPRFYPKQAKDSLLFCMITDMDMKKAIEYEEMLKRLARLYVPEETYFVAWGDSDYHVMDTACKRYKLDNPFLLEDYLDLGDAYRLYFNKDNNVGLRAAAEEQQVNASGLWHTAFDDAFNTGKVLKSLLEQGWTPELYFEQKEAALVAKQLKHQQYLQHLAELHGEKAPAEEL